jgi:hypothetical protein
MKPTLSKRTTESGLGLSRREPTLPSWNVLSRKQSLRGWTAWSDQGNVIAFQWSVVSLTNPYSGISPVRYRLIENGPRTSTAGAAEGP